MVNATGTQFCSLWSQYIAFWITPMAVRKRRHNQFLNYILAMTSNLRRWRWTVPKQHFWKVAIIAAFQKCCFGTVAVITALLMAIAYVWQQKKEDLQAIPIACSTTKVFAAPYFSMNTTFIEQSAVCNASYVTNIFRHILTELYIMFEKVLCLLKFFIKEKKRLTTAHWMTNCNVMGA